MKIFGRKKDKKADGENVYLGLREQALKVKPEDIGLTLNDNEQVYAAVVDMPFPENTTVTLVCVFDGAVSLYYSTGGGLIGIGEKYEEVRKAGMSFLFSAGQTLKFLDKTDEFELPDDNLAHVYLLAGDGTYQAVFDMGSTEKSEKYVQFLNFLIQNTLSKIRENTNK